MQADYRVDRLQIDENTGDVSIICWDNVYEEEFAKYLGNADEEWARDNAAAILDDSSFFMADEVKNELISTFGLEDYGHDMIDIEDADIEDISFDDIDDDASLLDDEYERPVEEEDFDEESLNYEDETNESFDLREALNRIDLNTDNHYDLLNLYESCNLTEGEKHRLATVVYDDAQPERIYDALNRRYLNNESLEDNLDEAIPAAVMALGTAAASGFGQAVGDKVSSKIFGEDMNDELDETWEPKFDDNWNPEDIEKWKSIDWKARNYDRFIDDSNTFEHDVVAYGLPGGEQHATAVFAKEYSANPIFPPAWKPINDPFEGKGTNGWYMYDGRTNDDGYLIHDRTETQEVSDALSESRMNEGVFDAFKELGSIGKDLAKSGLNTVKDRLTGKSASQIQKSAAKNDKVLNADSSKEIFDLARDAGADIAQTSDNKNTIINMKTMKDADKTALMSLLKEKGITFDTKLAGASLLQIPTSDLNKIKKQADKTANNKAKLVNMLKNAGITNMTQLKGILGESLDNEFRFRETKSVLDSDGFITDYTWYECADGIHVFVFGDTDVYGPEDGYFDHECDSEAEAREWFDSYNGFDEDELNESKSINEATSDYIKIGNTIYPKDMSKYDSDATAKEVADQAKKQYDDDVQKEREEKRLAAYRKGKEWVEWAKDNKSEARNQLRKMLSELWPVLDNKMIESILDKFPMGNVQLMYWMMLTEKPYTIIAAHINRDYTKFSDNYKVYLHRKELEKGEWCDFERQPSMYVGTDGTRAYFIQIYHSYYINPSTSLSETCGMSGSDGLTIIDVRELENETSYTFDELFNKLVSGSGKSDTLAGEIVRAWSRVMYRFYNDGDMISDDEPYGGVGEGARFVYHNVHDKKIEDLIDKLYDETDSKKYIIMLNEIKDLITDYINKNPQLLKIKNSKDYLSESKANESKSIKESSDNIFANNMEEFCNKLDLEYKWGEGIFYPKWDAYTEFRNKLDAAGLKDITFWYFQGSNPDKGRGNPDADICVSVEDEDSYAMVEVSKFPIYNKSKSINEAPDASIEYNPEYSSYIEEVAERFEAGEYDDAYEVCEYVANKFNKDINTVRDDINKLIRDSKSIREDIDVQYAIDWYVDSGAADEEAEEYCPENPDDWNVDNPYFEDRALSWFETSPYIHTIDDEYDWEDDLDESKSINEDMADNQVPEIKYSIEIDGDLYTDVSFDSKEKGEEWFKNWVKEYNKNNDSDFDEDDFEYYIYQDIDSVNKDELIQYLANYFEETYRYDYTYYKKFVPDILELLFDIYDLPEYSREWLESDAYEWAYRMCDILEDRVKSEQDDEEDDLDEARKPKVRKLKDSENTFNDTELEVKQEPISHVDIIKKLYELGGFEKLPVGRENAATIEIGAADKSRLTGYFKSKPEFNHEINTENDIISNEFISDKYDIEIFDSFVRAYKIPQNESLNENILEEATLKDKVNAALARYDSNED